MNKNTKKFVVTLLSVLMVLSFMPAMAFAASSADYDGGHYCYDEENLRTFDFTTKELTVPADTEGLKVLIAPTCGPLGYGVGELACTADLNGEACGFKKTVWISPLEHKPGRKIRVTEEDLFDYLNYNAWWRNFVRTRVADFCEGYVYVCDHCGAYVQADGTELTRASQAVDQTKHEAPKGTPKCATSFTCDVCGLKGATNDDFNSANAWYHDHTIDTTDPDENLSSETIIVHKEDATHYVSLESVTCSICEKVVKLDEATAHGHGGDLSRFDHKNTTRVVTKEPTCDAVGTYEEQCKDCGYVVESGEIKKLAHNFVQTTPYIWKSEDKDEFGNAIAEPDDRFVWTAKICDNCGAVKKGSVEKVGFSADTTEEVTWSLLAEATCEQGAWLLETITYSDGDVVQIPWSDVDVEDELADPHGDFVEIQGKFYAMPSKVEVPYAKALKHDFGKTTAIAEATCEERALEGKVCSKCGKPDHATVVEVGKPLGHEVKTITVAPTCGTAGYKYDTCDRCKYFLIHKTGKSSGYLALKDDDALLYAGVAYDPVDPIVASGTPCTFEWKVIKEATAEADGTKAEVCSVCGAIRNETPYSLTEDEKKQAARAEAEPVMSQAADIVADKTYTTASIKAIESAQADLKAALAAGSANDVKVATAALQKAIESAEKKAASTLKVKGKTVKAKAKKTTRFSAKKAFKVTGKAGKVTYKKKSGNGKVTVSKAGKVTVKKGLKAGKTYKVKVVVTDAGSGTKLGASKTVTLKVKVK